MSQRRKIAHEISLGRLSPEVLSMGPGTTLAQARAAFGGPDTDQSTSEGPAAEIITVQPETLVEPVVAEPEAPKPAKKKAKGKKKA